MDGTALLPGSILSLSAEAADRLLALGDGDAALLYLHLLRGTLPSSWPPQRLAAARERLAAQRLASGSAAAVPPPPAAPEEELPAPEYTTDDLTTALSQGAFAPLADEVERRLGKKLSTTDLKALYTLYDHLALPPEVILLLVSWCTEEVQRKYGPGRKPFLSQIRKEGFRWKRQGADTAEAAEEHLRRLHCLRTREGEVARLLDLPPRPLVEKEQKYIAGWLEMGFDNEALRLAYEKTVMGTASKSMDWRYMNGILRRWHEKGLHTLPQIRQGDASPSSRRTPPSASPPGPDRQTREDMERARRLMQRMKEEKGD